MLKLSVSNVKLVRVIEMTKSLLFRLFVARQAHFQPFFSQPVHQILVVVYVGPFLADIPELNDLTYVGYDDYDCTDTTDDDNEESKVTRTMRIKD